MKKSVYSTLILTVLVTVIGATLAYFTLNTIHQNQKDSKQSQNGTMQQSTTNLPATPIIIQRTGAHDVNISMTAQPSKVEIEHNVFYNAWTFNGTVPAPVIRVREGDTLHITLKNLDKNMPHSLDLHAVHAAPDKSFIDVMPGKDNTFTYLATTPGVFMYHCGTPPVLMHVGNGMYGMMIVEPIHGYPSDSAVKRSYTIIQSEWYKENNMQDMMEGSPRYVVFNGSTFSLMDRPLQAHVGECIRFYVVNAGPNHISAFHIVGAQFDTVYLNGSPKNIEYNMQTVLIPPGGSAILETTFPQEGKYTIMTHQLNDATKGAMGYIQVTNK